MIKKATLLNGMALNPRILFCAVSATLGDDLVGGHFHRACMGIDSRPQFWWGLEHHAYDFYAQHIFGCASTSPNNLRKYNACTLVHWALQAGYFFECQYAVKVLRALGIWKDP